MTTTPATVIFRIYPYATFSERVVLRDNAGVPVDLTGYTALMHVRRERNAPTPIFVLSTTDGSLVLDAEGGIALRLTPQQTAAPELTPPLDVDGEIWVHDLLLTSPAATLSVVDRLYQGVAFVYPGVTRPLATSGL